MRLLGITLFLLIVLQLNIMGQVSDTTVVDVPTGPADVVDLTGEAVIIKAEPDRPRVNIIADRLKPTFDTINLEKSFYDELIGKTERIIVLEKTSEKEFKPVNVEKILNKMR
jgi:hypothetical protein